MEILVVRCIWPGCQHLESDSSLEAAKRRVVRHVEEVHRVLLGPVMAEAEEVPADA